MATIKSEKLLETIGKNQRKNDTSASTANRTTESMGIQSSNLMRTIQSGKGRLDDTTAQRLGSVGASLPSANRQSRTTQTAKVGGNTSVPSAPARKKTNEEIAEEYRKRLAEMSEKDRSALFSGMVTGRIPYDLLAKSGYSKEDVDAIRETYSRDVNAQISEKAIGKTAEFTEKNTGTGLAGVVERIGRGTAGFVGARAGNLAGALTGTLQTATDTAKQLIRGSVYDNTDPNGLGYLPSRMAGTADSVISDEIEGENGGFGRKAGAFVYRGAANAADNLARMGVSMLIGGPAAGTVNSVFSFTQGFQSTYREAQEKGGNPVQGLLLGTIDGAMEVFTEGKTFERWMHLKDPELIAEGAYEWLKAFGTSIGNEIKEEEASYIVNTLADAIIMADKSESAEYYTKAIAEGKTTPQAWWELVKKYAKEIAMTAADTAVSTVLMNGVTGAIANHQYKQTYKGSERELVQEGLDSPEGTASRRIAEQNQRKLDSGRTLSGYDVKRQVLANDEQIAQEEAAAEAEESKMAENDSTARAEAEETTNEPIAPDNAPLSEDNAPANEDNPQFREDNSQNAAQSEENTAITDKNTAVTENNSPVIAKETEKAAEQTTKENETAETESTTEQTIEQAAEKYGEQKGAMEAVYNMDGGTKDVAKFADAYDMAYQMGKAGTPTKYLAREAMSALTEQQRMRAYQVGADAAKTAASAQSAKITEQADGLTGRKKGAVMGDGVTLDDLKKSFNDQQNRAYRVLSTVAEATGIDIVLFKSGVDRDGNYSGEQGRFSWKDGKIYIDVNSGLLKGKDAGELQKYAMVRTFSHEFTHFLEKYNAESYNDFRKIVFERMDESGLDVDNEIARYQSMDRSGRMTYEDASREVVADGMTDILEDSKFIQNIADNHKTIFAKLYEKLQEFISDLKAYFKTIRGEYAAAKALKQQVGEEIRYYEDIVKRFDEIAEQAVENYQKTVAVAAQEQTEQETVKAEQEAAKAEAEQEKAEERAVQHQARENKRAENNVRSMDIERKFIAYEKQGDRNRAESTVAGNLIADGRITEIDETVASEFIRTTNWENRIDARNCVRAILKAFVGESVYFTNNGKNGVAYLTGKGLDHALAGGNTKLKAISLEQFKSLIKNAEYAYSGKNDHGSIPGRVDWDYFVSVAKIGETTLPFVFAVRTVDNDLRSQIYSIATKESPAIPRGDGTQKESANAHPSYGDSPSYNTNIADEAPGVKTAVSSEAMEEDIRNNSDKAQNQQRDDRLTDRGVLYMAARSLEDMKLTDAQSDALRIFNERLAKLDRLNSQRSELEAQIERQTVERSEETQKALAKVKRQITAANKEVINAETAPILQKLLPKARAVVEEAQRKRDKSLSDQRHNAYVEGRKRTEIRNKILKKSENFRKMALAPRQANSLHAPVSLMNALADFCMIFADSEERGIERRRTELSQRAQENAARADGLKIKEVEQAVIERMEADLNKKLSAIQSLKNEYSEIKEHSEYGLYHDEQVQMWVDQLSDQLMDTDIREMTSEQLADVYKTMQAMEHAIVNANKAISAGKDKTFTGMLINLRSQIGNVNMRYGTAMNFAKRHAQWHMTPDTFWNYVCGFSKGNEGKTVQGMFQHGTERMLTVQRDFANAFRGFTETDNRETAKAIRDMMKAPMKNKVKWGLKNLAGEEIETSRGMMLQAYMLLKQKDSFDSIVYGGFKLPNGDTYYRGKTDSAYSDAERTALYGETVTDEYRSLLTQIQDGMKPVKEIDKKITGLRNAAKTTQEKKAVQQRIEELKLQRQEAMKPVEELQKKAQTLVEGQEARLQEVRASIESQLTDLDRALIAAADKWYQHSGELMTEVFENMYGFRPALVDGYTPIHRDLDTVTIDTRQDAEKAFNLENAGMTKERVKSTKPILLTDFFQELSNHTNQISRYYGFAQVQKDFNRLWNMRMPGTGNHTLKAMMSEKYGAGKANFGVSGKMYVENYIKSVAGSTYTDDILSAFYGNSASATLSANPRVALSQLASIPTASAVVGWRSMASGFAKGIGTSLSTAKKNQLANDSVWFYNRYRGAGGSTEFADLKMQGTLWEKVRDSTVGKALFNWCQEMDVFATASMWAMAEDYTERNGTLKNSDDFKEKVSQCYADIIRRTQPNYTATERSDLLRDQKAGMKLLTMYKTQSNQNLNILMNSVGEYRSAVLDYKNKRNGVTEADIHNAKVNMVNGITAVSLGGTVAFVLLRTLVNFALGKVKPYEDDETGEVTLASLLGAMGKEALGSAAGMFALGSLAFDFLYSSITGDKYYGVSDMALSGISDTLTDFNKLIQRAFDEDKEVRWEDVEKTLGSLLTLGGIPYKNVKTILAASNTWYQKLTGTFENTEELTQKQAVGRLLQAVKDGDSAKANDMIAFLAASSEESTDYEVERDVSTTIKSKIGDAYTAGKCTEAEAEETLKGYTVYSEEDIRAFIANWNGKIETGMTYEQAKKAYAKKRVDKEFILDYLKKYQLMNNSTAEKTELHLRCEREEGIVFSNLRDMVEKGHVSEKKAADILVKYDGKNREDADFAAKKWRFVAENPEYKSYSDTAIGKYFASGVPKNVFFKAYSEISAMEADKDANGKTISGSKKNKVVRYIQRLSLTYAQQKGMWNAVKGSMSDKGTPWE